MQLLLNFVRGHWAALAAFVVLLALVCGAYLHGISTGNTRAVAHYEAMLAERDRQAAEQLAQALAEAQAQAQAAMEAERKHLAAQTRTETEFRVITEKVVEYVEKNPGAASCGLDADGLRIWNSANRGRAEGASGNP